jgi:hypothetical protein
VEQYLLQPYLNIPMNYAARLWRLQGSHSAKNPAPQNLGQAHVCARDLLEMIDGAASRSAWCCQRPRCSRMSSSTI